MNNNEAYAYKQISASTLIKTGDGILGGLFVSAASATPTITIYDNTVESGTQIVSVFTPTAPANYAFPVGFATGCYIAISGTVSLTAMYV